MGKFVTNWKLSVEIRNCAKFEGNHFKLGLRGKHKKSLGK